MTHITGPFMTVGARGDARLLITVPLLVLLACADGADTSASPAAGGSGTGASSSGGGDAQSGGAAAGGSAGAEASGAGAQGGAGPDLHGFADEVAASICGALFRCCDDGSFERYFAPYAANERLASFKTQIPPLHTFVDEAECTSTVAEMLAVTPWRDWIDAAETGQVGFDEAAFASCRATLSSARCGAEVSTALLDSTCFGFDAPPGGSLQRRVFPRTRTDGATCAPIRDGIGSAFYGSCDPTKAFCCYTSADDPSGDCALPFEADGTPRSGTCRAVALAGEGCSIVPPLELCATGQSCVDSLAVCRVDDTQPLAVGALCIDGDYNLLGECFASFCDVLGTSKCEPLKADGAQCYSGYECQSDACEGQICGPSTFCVGG